MGYSLDRWVGVLEYFVIVFAFGAGVYFISVKTTYLFFEKNKKNRFKVRKTVKKKQIFFDVA